MTTQRVAGCHSSAKRRWGSVRWWSTVACMLLGLAATDASGQVNTEALRPKGQDHGLSGAATLDFALRSGNSESERAGIGLSLFHATAFTEAQADRAKRPVDPSMLSSRRLLLFVGEYDFEESRGDNVVNRGFVHSRITQMLSPRLGWEAFAQVEKDEFTRLDRRTLLGGGLRYGAYQRARAWMFLGFAVMGEWERIDERDRGQGARETQNVVRLTSYLNARWQNTAERLELSTTTYVQPALDDVDDYRILSQARLASSLTERLALTLTVNLRHDSEPPPGVEETDLDLRAGLRFGF